MLSSVTSTNSTPPAIKPEHSSPRLEDKETNLSQATPLNSRKTYEKKFQTAFQNVTSEADLRACFKSLGLDYQAQVDVLPAIRTSFLAPGINPLYFELQFGRSESWEQIYLFINYFNQSPVDIAKDETLENCINKDFIFAWHAVAEIYFGDHELANLAFEDLRLIPMNLFKDRYYPKTTLLPQHLEKTLYNIAGLLKPITPQPIENSSVIPPSTEPIIVQLAINKEEVENIIRAELPELADKKSTEFITKKISNISLTIIDRLKCKVSVVIGHQIFTGPTTHGSKDPITLISNTNPENKIILGPIMRSSTKTSNHPTFKFKLRHIENPSVMLHSSKQPIFQCVINMKTAKNIIRAGLVREQSTGFITGKFSNITVEAINPTDYKVSMKVRHQIFTGLARPNSEDTLTLISSTDMDNKLGLRFMKPATGIRDCATFQAGLKTALGNAYIISQSNDISSRPNSYDDQSFKASDLTKPGQYVLRYNGPHKTFILTHSKGGRWIEKNVKAGAQTIRFENGLEFNTVNGFLSDLSFPQVIFTVCDDSYILLDLDDCLQNLEQPFFESVPISFT